MKVAVVGGGIAGLAAAHRIVARWSGAEVVVLEAERRVGGVLRSEREAGYVHEHGANAFLAGAPDGAVALCRELEVPLEEAAPAARHRWIYIDGVRKPLPAGPGDLVRTDLVSGRAKLRALGEPLRARRRFDVEGDESVWDFAARRLGPEIARNLVAPFITGIFAGDAREISVLAGFPRLAELEAHGGLLRGSRALRRAHPDREKTRSVAPVGGVEALVRALADRLGNRLRLGARVTAVAPAGAGVEVTTAGAAAERFDAVVLASPAWVTATITAAVPDVASAAGAIDYAPVAVAYVGVRRDQLRDPLDGFGVLVAAGEQPRLLGAVFESSVWSDRAPAGCALIRCIYGGTRDPGALGLDDAALLAQARSDLGLLIGLDAAPVHTAVVRWPRAIAQYRLGHLDRVRAADDAARAHRLVLTGSGWHGVAVTDCVADSNRVVEELARWA